MSEIKISSEAKLSEPEKQMIAKLYSYCRFDEELFYPFTDFAR